MIRVDLHCHSSLSDGDLPPEQLAQRLAASRVVWAALTDHNTLAGQERFRVAAEKRGVDVVSGVEMDIRSPDGPLHLLVYGLDVRYEPVLHLLRTVRQPLRASVRHWFARARSLGGRGAPPGTVLQAVGGGLVPPGLPSAAAAISLIHRAGGRAFLAHPLAAPSTIERLEELLAWLQPQGLDGIEVFYKPYTESTRRDLLALAQHRGLLATAGSDFHGVHHAHGARPGVDMPLEHWERLAAALSPRRETGPRPLTAGGARR